MTYLHANEFAKKTNLPLRWIKNSCKEGKIPHVRIGRTYLLDEEMALAALLELQKQNSPVRVKPTKETKEKAKNFLAGLEKLREEETS